jgi:hypothetical protein
MLVSISLHISSMFNRREVVPVALSENVAPALTETREDFSEYVAHLQLHMTLQARNLVPSLSNTGDSRHHLLHQTQADIEKFVSRQGF